jgi:hypothetical protein
VDERLDRMLRKFFAVIAERIGLIYILSSGEKMFLACSFNLNYAFNVHKSMY